MDRLEYLLSFALLLDFAGMAYSIGNMESILLWGSQLIINTTLWAVYKKSIKANML